MGELPANPAVVAQAKIYEEKVLLTVLVSRPQASAMLNALPEGSVYHMQSASLKMLSDRKKTKAIIVAMAVSITRTAQRIIEEIVS
jgi:hypothetical protein